jgi:hypothetical protein
LKEPRLRASPVRGSNSDGCHGTHSGNIPSLKAGPNADYIGSGFVTNANERGGRGFFGSTTPGSAELAEDFAQHVTEDAIERGGLSSRIEPAYVGSIWSQPSLITL